MDNYRIKDNRGKYWLWYRHSHHFKYGQWVDNAHEATHVTTLKHLKSMIRDVYRTIKSEKELNDLWGVRIDLNQIAKASCLSVEKVVITDSILESHQIFPDFTGNTLRVDFK